MIKLHVFADFKSPIFTFAQAMYLIQLLKNRVHKIYPRQRTELNVISLK
jgi:hypothetical protein